MDRYIGRMLDNRYEILEVIGSGGMAVVYKARCHRLNRLVAIKILKDENLQDQDFRRRFHAESQAVAMLSHPNIVSVYDVSMDSDEDYLVMELIEGISLKQYMEKKGVLNWKETLHFAIQIAKALDHAHSKGLVHRDIKPHNVMVLRTGAVKVADFGIARMMSKSNTLTKEALGSVHYISPEQAKGGRVDNRSDIYSLGVVMYEMITGRVPYDGESPVSVAIQHINGGAPKPSALNPGIPVALEQIILKAIATNPKERYPDVATMLHDMDEFRRDPTIVLQSVPQEEKREPAVVVPATPRTDSEVSNPPAEKKTAPKPPVKPELKKKRDYAAAERRRSTIATVAIVLCSLLIMVAIVLSLVVLLRDEGPVEEHPKVSVPALVGMYYSRLPEYDGLEIVVQGSAYSTEFSQGQIIRQEPKDGTEQEYGSKVFITVSLGPRPADHTVTMINLVGRTQAYAKQWLDDQGLNLTVKVTEEYSNTVAAGNVISTDPAEGATLAEDERVTLVISLGKETDIMPNLVGSTLATAQNRMSRTKFSNVQWVPQNSTEPAGTILSQDPSVGTEVALDARIVITYSNGIAPDEDPVTKEVVLENLPYFEEDFYVSIVTADGQIILLDHLVSAGQTSCAVELSGVGTMELRVYVDGAFFQTITVNFTGEELPEDPIEDPTEEPTDGPTEEPEETPEDGAGEENADE